MAATYMGQLARRLARRLDVEDSPKSALAWNTWSTWALPIESIVLSVLLLWGLLHLLAAACRPLGTCSVLAPHDVWRLGWAWLGLAWIGTEAIWRNYIRNVCVPRLATFHPEDANEPVKQDEFDRAIDNVCFLIERDAAFFWLRVTGVSFDARPVPSSTIRSYVRSLLFMFEETKEQAEMLQRGVNRIIASCITNGQSVSLPADADDGFGTAAEEAAAPNMIRGWSDDSHLASIISPTPLILSAAMGASVSLATGVLFAFGWRRGPSHGPSGLECLVLRPTPAAIRRGRAARPLVLLPGAPSPVISRQLPSSPVSSRQLPSSPVISRLRSAPPPFPRPCHLTPSFACAPPQAPAAASSPSSPLRSTSRAISPSVHEPLSSIGYLMSRLHARGQYAL